MAGGSNPVRKTVYYSGRVQGVGFRYTTQAIAARYAVTGVVRNLPDGRVELVAEGTAKEMMALLAEVRDRFEDHIHDEKTDTGSPSGEFSGFKIGY